MSKTIVELNIPFTFVAADEYNISFNKNIVRIEVKIIQNKEQASKMHPEFNFFGNITLLPSDHHGLFNTTSLKIEFPYFIKPFIVKDIVGNNKIIERESDSQAIEKECLICLNKLIDIVKWCTKKYWIQPLSSRDLFINKILKIDDNGKGRVIMGFGDNLRIPFNLAFKNESEVKNQIDKLLLNEENIPFYSNIYLDAFNALETRRFNEAVILINIALEGIIAEFLIRQLIKSGSNVEEAKRQVSRSFSKTKGEKAGLHYMVTDYFKEIVGYSLEENKDLWNKFNNARNKRKNAIHPYISQIEENHAIETVNNILAIIKWIAKRNI